MGMVGTQRLGALGEPLPLFHGTAGEKDELEEGRGLRGGQVVTLTLFLEKKLPQL